MILNTPIVNILDKLINCYLTLLSVYSAPKVLKNEEDREDGTNKDKGVRRWRA